MSLLIPSNPLSQKYATTPEAPPPPRRGGGHDCSLFAGCRASPLPRPPNARIQKLMIFKNWSTCRLSQSRFVFNPRFISGTRRNRSRICSSWDYIGTQKVLNISHSRPPIDPQGRLGFAK
uniref:Uncharacterized protein n=1 Tax=Ananas comosus var. bracteatus TaxID=296719 RepID=A0A6V7Q796_ANACO|nr:unnamed protein product [Ananas comosus var. bracteatus]